MRVKLAIMWDVAPEKGRIEVAHGELLAGGIHQGWGGEYLDGAFSFTERDPCEICCVIEAEDLCSEAASPVLRVTDTAQPFSFLLRGVLGDRATHVLGDEVRARAEEDVWAALSVGADGAAASSRKRYGPVPAGLPLYEGFTDGQRAQFGPVREREVLSTSRHVYSTPFMYDNVDVGDFYEIDPAKGVELRADTGFITIAEELPIVAVTVVGSGCTSKGYNICEWWDEGESIDTLTGQLVKRQRVDNLNGTHPSIWSLLLMGRAGGVTFRDVAGDDMTGPVECLKKLSEGYYGGYDMGFYENTAHFRVGPPYPRAVTVRCGCKVPEDPGTSLERYPGDYAVRVVETTVIRQSA